MTHTQSVYTAAPQRRRRRWPWVVAALVLLAACGIGALAAIGSGVEQASKGTPFATSHTAGTPAAGGVPAPVKGADLTAKDLALSVKITDRECFGSAGCNVQYSIKLTAARAIPDSYTITYTVHGFEDGDQVGTLTLDPDGKYTQDSFNQGSVKSASTKLTAKITDMERA